MNIEIDYGELWATMNAIESITKAIDSRRFRAGAFKALKATAVARYGAWMDAQAEDSPDELWHVYEWGQIADPQGRLFDIIFEQGDTAATARAQFLQSYVQVPLDPNIPGERRRHVFRAKAWAFEYGIQVTVAQVDADKLVWHDGTLQVSATPTQMRLASGTMAGNFRSRWDEYWSGQQSKQTIANEVVRPFEQWTRTHARPFVEREVMHARVKRRAPAPRAGGFGVTVNRPVEKVIVNQVDVGPLLQKWGRYERRH